MYKVLLANLYNSIEIGVADAVNSTPSKIHNCKFKKTFKNDPFILLTSSDYSANVFSTIVGVTNTQFSFRTNYTGNTNIIYLAIERS